MLFQQSFEGGRGREAGRHLDYYRVCWAVAVYCFTIFFVNRSPLRLTNTT